MAKKNSTAEVTAEVTTPAPAEGTVQKVNPFDIPLPEAGVESLGRGAAVSDDAIVALAVSIFDHGQQSAVRTDDEGIIYGTSRVRACRLIREGFTGADGKVRLDPEFTVDVIREPRKLKPEERFLAKLEENVRRNNLTIYDQAEAALKLKEYKYTKVEIGRIFGYNNANRSARLLRVLDLDPETLKFVKAGKLDLYPAMRILDSVPLADRPEAIQFATDDNGDVLGSKLDEWVRLRAAKPEAAETPAATGATEPGEQATPTPAAEESKESSVPVRPRGQIIKLFEGFAAKKYVEGGDETPAEVEAYVNFAKKFLQWAKADIATDTPVERALTKIYDAGKADAGK